MMKCNMTFEMTYINFINYLDILSDDSIIYNWLAMENHQKGGLFAINKEKRTNKNKAFTILSELCIVLIRFCFLSFGDGLSNRFALIAPIFSEI